MAIPTSPSTTRVLSNGSASAAGNWSETSISPVFPKTQGETIYDLAFLVENGWTKAADGVKFRKTGAYGEATFSIVTGSITYILDNSSTATRALSAGQQVSDSFGQIALTDGTASTLSETISFAITGSNDAPTVSISTPNEPIVEAGGTKNSLPGTYYILSLLNTADIDGTAKIDTSYLEENGWLKLELEWNIYAKFSTYGILTLTPDTGYLEYNLQNSWNATEYLTAGQQVSDNFGQIAVTDGTATTLSETISFVITGTNDAPTVSTSTQSKTLVEAGGLNNSKIGSNTSTIQLSIDDVDGVDKIPELLLPEISTKSLTSSASTKSILSNFLTDITNFDAAYLESNGWAKTIEDNEYTKLGIYGNATFSTISGAVIYVLNNSSSATQSLRDGQKVTDNFGKIAVTDGTDVALSETISFVITGSNDAPTVNTSSPSARLVEAGGVNNSSLGTNISSVQLDIADLDGVASFDKNYLTEKGWAKTTDETQYTKAGTYGTAYFSTITGKITYTLNNKLNSTQALNAGQQVKDSFGQIAVTDGEFTTLSENISFEITGAKDETGIPIIIEDTGASQSDRITKKGTLTISGLKPNTGYQYSTNSGETWTSVTSPNRNSSALRFDGSNDYVSIPNNTMLPAGSSAYTLEAWIQPEAMGDRGIIGWGPWGQGSSVNALRLMGNGQIRHYWWGNDLDVNVGNLADGKWHHVAATYDGRTRKVYVDGVLKGSDTPSRHSVPVNAINVRIGSTNNGEYFQGSIDDAAVWSKALTQQDITDRLTTAPKSDEKDLVLLYNFEEGTGTTVAAKGSAGYGLAGTLTNGPTWTTRNVQDDQKLGTVDLKIDLKDGTYSENQFLVRDQESKTIIAASAEFTVDSQASTVKLNTPGGADSTISGQTGDNIITGYAEPGQKLSLLSKLGSVKAGNLKVTADNGCEVYLNGELIGQTDDWGRPYDFTGLNVLAGTNVLAIVARDWGGIAGMTGRFEVPSGTFGTSNINNWKVLNVDPDSLTDNSAASQDRKQWKLPANWASTSFDDSGWSAPIDVRAQTGQYPWGNRTGDPTWIWSADPYNHDVVLFRYTFTGTSTDEGLETVADNIQVNSDGSFSYALTSEQIKRLGQGTGKTLVAVQEDLAGNIGKSSMVNFAIDTEIKPVQITSIGGGDGKVTTELVETGQGALKLQLDQYTGFWSSKLSELQQYVKNYNPSTSKNRYTVITDVIDYTDDQGGFAGELPFDRRWPAAESINYWGTGGINNQFFVKISGDFYANSASKYRFRTFNDDGVFLLIDGKLVINDPTLHPEYVFTGDIDLAAGNHNLELFFFENGGEASLEFSVSRFDSAKNTWGAYQLVGMDPTLKSKSVIQADNLVEGTGEANTVINITLNDKLLGKTTSDSSGNFKYELSKQNIDDIAASGSSNGIGLIATQTDLAGNISSSKPSQIAVLDITPVIKISAVGNSNKQITSKSSQTITGLGSKNLLTNIYYGDKKIGETTADQDGNFNYSLTGQNLINIGQGTDKKLTVEQITSSGVKGRIETFGFSVDTIAPEVNIDSAGIGNWKISSINNLIFGRGEANGTVALYLGQTLLGQEKVDSKGEFRHLLSAKALEIIAADPKAKIFAQQSDSAGNVGVSQAVDISAKLKAPEITNLLIGGTDAVISSKANDSIISGKGESGLTTSIYFNNIQLGSAIAADKDGLFSYTLTADNLKTIGQGSSFKLNLQQRDEYGNLGSAMTASFGIDTIAPQLLIPLAGEMSALGGKDSIVSTQTGDARISGKGESGSSLVISYANNVLSSFNIASDGLFTYTLTDKDIITIGQGSGKSIKLLQSDAAGNQTESVLKFGVDTTPPPSPKIISIATDGVVSSLPTDNIVQGSTEPNSEVLLYVNGISFTKVTADNKGNFSYKLTSQDLLSIGEGKSVISAEIADAAGNLAKSQAISFKVDTIAPTVPELLSVGGSDNIISTKGSKSITQTVDNLATGNAEPESLVSVYFGKTLLGQTKTDLYGTFKYAVSASNIATLGQGTDKNISVIATDSAGNSSVPSKIAKFSVDTLAPISPKISQIGGSDSILSSVQGDNKLLGTAEALSNLVLIGKNNSTDLFSISLVSDSIGRWSYDLSNQQLSSLASSSSPKLQAIATDYAGNESDSVAFDINIDISAPVLKINPIGGSDLTISSTTEDSLISGSAEANLWVQIAIQGRKLAEVKADQKGLFSYQLTTENLRSIGEGKGKLLQISQVDLAGNSSIINSSEFSVDVTAPSKATISSIGGTDKLVTSLTEDRQVNGTAEAGSTIDLFSVTGTTRSLLGSQTIGSNGQFTYTLTPDNLKAIGKGVGRSIEIASKDTAGNASISQPFSYQVQARWATGTNTTDTIRFESGVDAITGLAGADTFIIPDLGTVLIDNGISPSFDRLTDFQIGVDRLDAPQPVAIGQVKDLGKIQALNTTSIVNLLTPIKFPSYAAAIFRYDDLAFGSRTFLAINDVKAGFETNKDGIVEITGYSGSLSNLYLI